MFALLTFLLALYIILTSEVSSIDFIFSLLVLMLYIIPYFTLWNTFTHLHLVSEKGGADFFTYIFGCYLSYFLGAKIYSVLKRNKDNSSLINVEVDHKKYEQYSIIVGLIGVAGYGYFILKSGAGYFMGHNSGDFTVGGYIYELRYFVFSSFLLLFQIFLSKDISRKGLYFLCAIALFLAFDAYVQQQRGSWIRFGIIILLSYLFSRNDERKMRITTLVVKYKFLFVLGIFFAFLLSFTLQMRRFYSVNSSLAFQISATLSYIVDKPDVLFGGSGIDEGNEFVTAYNAYRSNDIAQTYDYGYKWLYPFLNFIPRALWKDKPNWGTFSNDIFSTMDKYVVFGHTNGSAETGLIDAFYRFLYFAPAFFFLFGLYCSKLHFKAKEDFGTRLFYICFLIGTFYFITQNMMPFVIFTLYMYIPIGVVLKLTVTKGN